jgi:hypothetical protein
VTSSTTSSKSIIVVQNGSTMSMKKGKANVPPQMRGQYKRQAEMNEQQQAMMAASRPGEDGFPVFNLFVRTKTKKVNVVVNIYICIYIYIIVLMSCFRFTCTNKSNIQILK